MSSQTHLSFSPRPLLKSLFVLTLSIMARKKSSHPSIHNAPTIVPLNPHTLSLPPNERLVPAGTYNYTETDLLEQEIRDQLQENRKHDRSRQASLDMLNRENRTPTYKPVDETSYTNTHKALKDNEPLQAAYTRLVLAAKDYTKHLDTAHRSRFHVLLREIQDMTDKPTAYVLSVDACIDADMTMPVMRVLLIEE